jgi:hypothetical protein
MITNKSILGFFVVLVAIVVMIVLVRKNSNFLSRFRGTPTPTQNQLVSTNPTQSPDGQNIEQGTQNGLIACTSELKSACTSQVSPVCGSERVQAEDINTTRSLTFKNACTYCSLYGTDDVLQLGDEKYFPLGYTNGGCTLTK